MPTPSPLVVTADITPRVNLAHQQNHLPFFRRLEIRNPGLDAAVDIRVTSTASPPFFAPWDLRIDAIPAGLTHVVAPVPLVLAPDFLARQLEREVGFVELVAQRCTASPDHGHANPPAASAAACERRHGSRGQPGQPPAIIPGA